MDERREFKIQWLSCGLTFPCPILLAASLADFRRQDTYANNTLSEPAHRLTAFGHLLMKTQRGVTVVFTE